MASEFDSDEDFMLEEISVSASSQVISIHLRDAPIPTRFMGFNILSGLYSPCKPDWFLLEDFP